MTQAVNSLRRYYLLKWLEAEKCTEATEQAWHAKQLAVASTDLPSDFPGRAILLTAGYSTVDDVNGADIAELRRVGLDRITAEEALKALQLLI